MFPAGDFLTPAVASLPISITSSYFAVLTYCALVLCNALACVWYFIAREEVASGVETWLSVRPLHRLHNPWRRLAITTFPGAIMRWNMWTVLECTVAAALYVCVYGGGGTVAYGAVGAACRL